MSGDFDKMRCTDNFSAYISEYVKDASDWTALPAAATEQEAKTSKPDPSELSTAKHASKRGGDSDPADCSGPVLQLKTKRCLSEITGEKP